VGVPAGWLIERRQLRGGREAVGERVFARRSNPTPGVFAIVLGPFERPGQKRLEPLA